jgi:Ras-like protein family protein 11A
MNSSPIKGIRRKKSLLSEIKVLVVGGPSVGKSGQTHFNPIVHLMGVK